MKNCVGIVLFIIFGVRYVKCCSISADGLVYNITDLNPLVLKDVPDSLKQGEIIKKYSTKDIKSIKDVSEEPFIDVSFASNSLTFTAKKDFSEFELNATELLMSKSLTLACDDKDNIMTLNVELKDTDNHDPIFNKHNYQFTMPMPWPAGISIPKVFGDIWVYDADISSKLIFRTSVDTTGRFNITLTEIRDHFLPGETYFKPYYILDFSSKEALDVPSLSLNITVMDENNPETSTTATITLNRDPKTSMAKSPTFDRHWYLIQIDDEINAGDQLEPIDGPIRIKDYDDITAVQLDTEGDSEFISHFHIQKSENTVLIDLKKNFADPKPQIGTITLKANVTNAAQPGYSVLNFIFPSTIITTVEPCTTPQISTSTSTTPTSPYPSTGVHSSTTDPDNPSTSTEDPCNRCPTIITDCPSMTSISESTCPVCNETTTTENIWSTDASSRSSEGNTCPACDCPSTAHSPEDSSTTNSCPVCETSTTPEVTTCPTCDCSSTTVHHSTANSCMPCEPCPSNEPPAHCLLSFPQNDYRWTLHAGDMGEIGSIEAKSNPPIDSSEIVYIILDENLEITQDFKISMGKMHCLFPLEAKYYNLTVLANATCQDIDDIQNATVHLSVYSFDICGNESAIEILFPESVKILKVDENTIIPELTTPPFIPNSLDCTFSLEVEPWINEFHIDPYSGSIYMQAIDRENEIFQGADIPEIKLNITALCSVKTSNDQVNKNLILDSSTKKSASMMIIVYINDVNDSPPTFKDESITIGYPIKSIAEDELPSQLGIAEAHDADYGENAAFIYMVTQTSEVIIEESSGHFYPHPYLFQYEDFEFKVVAKDKDNATDCSVKVKILSEEYLTVIWIKGAQVADAHETIKNLSNITGFHIGIVTARLVNSFSSYDSGEDSFEISVFGETSYVFTDSVKETHMGVMRSDDTYSLRLLVYAFKDGEAIESSVLQELLKKIEGPFTAKEYTLVRHDQSSSNQSSAIIALSVVLALLILGVTGFFVYRFWRTRGNRDNNSLEEGLVQEKNDGIKNIDEFMYQSENNSLSRGETGITDKSQDLDDTNAERRKSVAFAEEPQVIPGDDEESHSKIVGSQTDVRM